ncbi:MAG: GNAT family N-acetyltransferase [Spirochaetales bacterium]|nr:GNAT family N-acetyltransferase [Spirochaetales bacterium]
MYELNKNELSEAAGLMIDAFAHDPLWIVFFSGCSYNSRRASFMVPLAYCRCFGGVYAPSEGMEGICAWTEGKKAFYNFSRTIRSGVIPHALAMGKELGQRMKPLFRATAQDMKDNMGDRDFIYLQLLGVGRENQGKGYGGQLLKELLDKSDREGRPLYLETETEKNVAWYGKRGFSVVKEIFLEPQKLPLWEMVREPKAGS